MQALLYLYSRQVLNFLRTSLRSPKRLLTLLIVGIWGVGVLSQTLLALRVHPPPEAPSVATKVYRGGAFGLLLFLALSGLSLSLEGAFVFPLAEVDFLFPTPIPRRTILLWKLLRDDGRALLVGGLYLFLLLPVMTLASGRSQLPWLPVYWVALTLLGVGTVHLAYLLGLLVMVRWPALYEQRRWVSGGFSLSLILTFLGWAWGKGGDASPSWPDLLSALNHPMLQRALFPLAWMADLLLLPWTGWNMEQAGRLLGLLLFALLSGAALLALRVNLYELALGPSVASGRLQRAWRVGGWMALQAERQRLQPSRARVRSLLPPKGRGALALLWKEWASALRSPWRVLAAVLTFGVAFPFLLHFFLRLRFPLPGFPLLLLFLYIEFLWFFSLAFYSYWQNFWRHLEWLKPIPVPGWKMLLAYALPTVINTAALMALSLLVLMALSPLYRTLGLQVMAGSAFALLLLLSLVACFTAYLFPRHEWSQSVLAGMVMMLLSGLLLAPSLVLGGLLAFFQVPPFWAILTLNALQGSLVGLALILGHHLYERWEPSEE